MQDEVLDKSATNDGEHKMVRTYVKYTQFNNSGLYQMLIIIYLLESCLCFNVAYPPKNNYNYDATTLLATSQKNQIFPIDCGFDFKFGRETYNRFYISSDGKITFDARKSKGIYTPTIQIQFFLSSTDSINILVKSTKDNVTVSYISQSSFSSSGSSPQGIIWILTFYKAGKEMFDIDIIQNTHFVTSGVIRSSDISLAIDNKTIRVTRYTDSLTTLQIVGIVLGCVGFLIVFGITFAICWRCRGSLNCDCSCCCACNCCKAAEAREQPESHEQHRHQGFEQPLQVPSAVAIPINPLQQRSAIQLQPLPQNHPHSSYPLQEHSKQIHKDNVANHASKNKVNIIPVDEICSICLETDPEVLTRCRHLFHRKCLFSWEQRSYKCPNCNQRADQFYSRCPKCKLFNIPATLDKSIVRHRECQKCRAMQRK